MVKLASLFLAFLLCSCSEQCKRKSIPSTSTTTTAKTTTTTTTSPPPSYSPILLTEPDVFKVMEGDNITLTCLVDAIVSSEHEISPCPCTDLQIVWKKGNKTLQEDDDIRVEVEMTGTGSTVIIKEAQETDAGEYTCKVLDVEIVHTVEIIVRPEVVPVPESGLVTVKTGEPATIACKVTRGGPKTFISWKTAEGYPLLWLSDSQTIPKAEKWTAGVFKCTAHNEWPEPASAEIRLDVQHAPEIRITATADYTYAWTRLTPTCYVEASPGATVEWYKNDQKLEVDDLNSLYSKIHLKEMGLGYENYNDTWVIDQDKIGVYECRARNYLGETSAAIDVYRSCDRLTGEDCYKIVKEVTTTTGPQDNTEVLNDR